MRKPRPSELRDFETACELLANLTRLGFEIYVSGSGSVHLMTGPSHSGHNAQPLRDNIASTHCVPGMSGGDW